MEKKILRNGFIVLFFLALISPTINAQRVVTFSGANTAIVSGSSVTITKESESTSSQSIPCISSSNLQYLTINGAASYFKLALDLSTEKIDSMRVTWRANATNQAIPAIFGSSITVGAYNSVSNVVQATNGGVLSSAVLASSGVTNCPNGDLFVFPSTATVKEVLLPRRINYDNTSFSVGSTYSLFLGRLNNSTSTGYTSSIGLGNNVNYGSIVLYISNITTSTTPTITASPSTAITFGNLPSGTTSAPQTFNVSATNLTGAPGNITVVAPNSDFQVSVDNTNWLPSVNIPYIAATLTASPVFVRFSPQTAGAKSGNVTVGGGGATAINIAVTGTGTAAVYNYRSKTSGNWTDASTWEYDNGGWTNALVAPTDADGIINIMSGHTVTISTATTADELIVNLGATLEIAANQTLTIANGNGTDITVNGTLKNSGTLTTTGATTAIATTGVYQHDAISNIPTFTWPAGSTCLVTGGSGVPGGGYGQAFANLTWNCSSQSTQVVIASTGFTVTGNFNVVSTGIGGIQMISSGGVTNAVVGSYTQSGGWVYIYPNTAARSLTSNGDFTLNGGQFGITGQGGTGSATLYVKGNIAFNGGTVTRLTGTTANLELNGTTLQTIGSAISAVDTFNATINNPAGVTLMSSILLNGAVNLTSGIVNTTASNYLILGTTATVSGGSATSFINGPLVRLVASNVATTLVNPVGKGTSYSPVELTVAQAAAIPTTYTVEAFNSAPATNTLPSTIEKVSDTRYYSVVKSAGAPVTAATIKLLYDGADASATGISVADKSKIRIVKTDGAGNWVDLGPAAGGSANNAGNATSNSFTTFSLFAIANLSTSTPVKFASIAAKDNKDKITVTWNVASEINTSHYELQSGKSGGYTTIAKINATQSKVYEADDLSPNTGLNIYRVKAVDKDGSITYSSVVSINRNTKAGQTLTIMGNPVIGRNLQLQATGYTAGKYNVNVYNSLGVLVQTNTIALTQATTNFTVELASSLAKGVYQVVINGANERTVKAFVVQ